MRKSALFGFGLVVMVLVTLGLVVLASASQTMSAKLHGGDVYFFLRRQSMYLCLGVVIATVTAMFDYRHWRNLPWLTILMSIGVFAMLLWVFKYEATNGSKRWIVLGTTKVQPSEFAKLATVILLSMFLDRAGWRVELFKRGALLPALLIGVFAAPIIAEPDFGSFFVVVLVGFLLMFVAGTRFLHLIPFFAIGMGVFTYRVVTNRNRLARLLAFFGVTLEDASESLDKAADSAAYQVQQALIAIKNGWIGGRGLGESMQKYYYLPESHTDFIFAVGAEELGIVFSVGVLVLFVLFFAYCVYFAKHAADRFGKLLVVGMGFVICFQAVFNIGVVCKALPTKGIALPFFSYGGTNMVCAFFAVGTVLSVGIQAIKERKRTFKRNVFV